MVPFSNSAKSRLRAGELAIGMGLRHARTVEIAHIAKTLGFDWLFIDMEHNSMNIDTAAQICMGALPIGVAPIVRVPGKEHHHASRALDSGAQGVVVPHVDTPEEAAQVVANCKYPPIGTRSVTAAQPLYGFASVPLSEAAPAVNEETLIIVLLETPQAISNADAIAATPGIDVVMIGTNDLCAEMGISGQFGHERTRDAYRTVTAACQRHGKWAGMAGCYDHALMQEYIEMGVRCVLGGSDFNFVQAGARPRMSFLRGLKV